MRKTVLVRAVVINLMGDKTDDIQARLIKAGLAQNVTTIKENTVIMGDFIDPENEGMSYYTFLSRLKKIQEETGCEARVEI